MDRFVAVYVRVSSRRQDTRSQEPDLHRWVEAYADAPVKWYRDKLTGKTMDRPDWRRLEADMVAGKVSKIVVWRLDRLGRTAAGLTATRAGSWCESSSTPSTTLAGRAADKSTACSVGPRVGSGHQSDLRVPRTMGTGTDHRRIEDLRTRTRRAAEPETHGGAPKNRRAVAGPLRHSRADAPSSRARDNRPPTPVVHQHLEDCPLPASGMPAKSLQPGGVVSWLACGGRGRNPGPPP
jgi:hypothetical protein